MCGRTLRQAFRFLSFLSDAATAPSSLAQPLRPQSSALTPGCVTAFTLFTLPSNSTRTRPFVLTDPNSFSNKDHMSVMNNLMPDV